MDKYDKCSRANNQTRNWALDHHTDDCDCHPIQVKVKVPKKVTKEDKDSK